VWIPGETGRLLKLETRFHPLQAMSPPYGRCNKVF
jgi:hypothetical protein